MSLTRGWEKTVAEGRFSIEKQALATAGREWAAFFRNERIVEAASDQDALDALLASGSALPVHCRSALGLLPKAVSDWERVG